MSGVSLFPPFFWQLLAVSFGAPLSTVNVHSAEELSWSFDASVFFFFERFGRVGVIPT